MGIMRRNSLRDKLILFLLASIILPISTSILITYGYTKESVKHYHIRETTNLIHQGAMNIMNYMNQANEASLLIYNNLSESSSLYQLIQDGSQTYLEDREMYRNLQFIANSLKEIEQVYLYSSVEDISYRFAYNLMRSSPGRTYEAPEFGDEAVWTEAVHMSHEYGVGKPRFSYHIEQEVFTIHRAILEAPSDDILGHLAIDFRTDKIREISQALYTPGEQLYIFDDRGRVIFAPHASGMLDENSNNWMREILEREDEQGSFQYEDSSFAGIHVYERMSVPGIGWVLVERIPYETLYQDARQVTLINSLVLSLFLIIAVIATLYISFWFTTPIKQLIRYITQIEHGRFDSPVGVQRSDEIGILARRFQQLIERLHQLIMREYRLELANKTNQLKALQAQVNPHFLNNALQSIGTLALQHGDRKVYSLITSLGKMMRYQSQTDVSAVPLSSEIEYVKSYLSLQGQRFEGQLQYQIEVEEQAADILVPKMIMQPIVENYFKHGFQGSAYMGEIVITCRIEGDEVTPVLRITVEDNGCGIEDDKLGKLQKMLSQTTTGFESGAEDREHEHLGLINVISRLRLFYERDVLMTLEPRKPHGLRVIISIPLKTGGSASEGIDRG